MQSNLARYRFFIALTFGLMVSVLPAGILPARADTLSEAQPTVQSQPIETIAKPEAVKDDQQTTKETAPSPTSEEASFGEEPNDPLESLNRMIFDINSLVDFVIVRPAAEIYRAILPEPVRNGVTNVIDNLFAPVVFLNHTLQGEAERATATLFRLLVNSSFGLFGLVDAASELGYPRYDTDFNQTLTAWGVDTGPYLILPLIGPSSFRGTAGFLCDYSVEPLNIYLNNRAHRQYRYWLTIRNGLDIVGHRERVIETIDNLAKNSLDMYVTMRSIYFQRQAYMAEKLKSANTPEVAKEEDKQNTS